MSIAKRRILIAVAILLVSDLTIFGTWYAMWHRVEADGGATSLFYQEKYEKTVVEHDPDFGDTSKKVWVDQMTPGLLDNALPASGGITAIVVGVLIYLQMKDRRKA